MYIYVDVLLLVNLIVNYYLLLLTSKLLSLQYRNLRLIFSATLGSFFSLYIFFQINNILIDITVKFLCSAVMVFSAFGYENIKKFLRVTVYLFGTSFIYAGAIMAFWMIFKPKTVIINNSVVYYDISPIFLIVFSVVFYLLIVLIRSLLKKNSLSATECLVSVNFNNKTQTFNGIFDTGNNVKDILTGSSVIFISKNKALDFLGAEPRTFEKQFRLIPCATVIGSNLLEAVRCDNAEVIFGKQRIVLNKPILAISEVFLNKEYDIILNPEILEFAEE